MTGVSGKPGSGSPANPGLLVVVDLHAHGLPSRILRGMLRSRVFDRTGIAGAPWLVLAPPGDGGDRAWCRGSEILEPAGLLGPHALQSLTTEAIEISNALEQAFASADSGPNAGRINRDFIRMWVHELMYREHAISAGCQRVGAARVRLLSSHASRSRWLATGLAERGLSARGGGLPDWMWQRRSRRDGVPAWPAVELPRADLLLVAESVPIAQSFAAVAEALPLSIRAETLALTYLPSAPKVPADSIRQINLAATASGASPAGQSGPALIGVPGERALPPPGLPGSVRSSFEALRGRLIAEGLPGQQAWARHVRGILRKVRPRLVVVGNDRCWTGQVYTLLARSEGIETVVLQDGIAAQNDPTWKYATADHVLAAGTLWPRLLSGAPGPTRSITVVGQPRYDGVARCFRARREDSSRPGPAGHRVLLVLQDIHAPDYVRTVLDEILCLESVEVMVRAHPAFRPAGLDRLTGPRVRFSPGGGVVDDLAWADLVVTEYSTVAVEALALGLPVLSVTLSGRPPLLDFTVPGQAEGVGDRSGIGPALHRLLGSEPARACPPERQAILDELVGPLDDRSASRVADIVGHFLEPGAA